jgi:hypothetical protein
LPGRRKKLILGARFGDAGMLPSGFKKDSRVWLHKNPKAHPDDADVDKTAVLKRFLESERAYNENSPCFFVEFQGRQFKKDSRSWLHKSSIKKTQPPRTRRKGPGPVAGDCCREPVSIHCASTDIICKIEP